MTTDDGRPPWEQAAPAGPGATPRPVPVRPVVPSSVPVWGGSPVTVPRGGRLQPVAAVAGSAHFEAGTGALGVAELLRLRDRERTARIGAIAAAGWPGPRSAVVGSLFGGVGVSTLAAQLAWTGRTRRLPTVLLDGSGAYGSGAASRLASAIRMDYGPSWADLAGLASGPAGALAGAFGARLPSLSAEVPVLVGGRSETDHRRPPSDLVGAAIVGALDGGWPLVTVDAGGGADEMTAALSVWDSDLAVLVCRADPAEVRESADYLRFLAESVGRPPGRSVLAIVHAGRLTRSVAQARAAVSDTAAGSVAVQMVERLRDRSAVVAAAPPAVALLMAALAISSSSYSSGRSI